MVDVRLWIGDGGSVVSCHWKRREEELSVVGCRLAVGRGRSRRSEGRKEVGTCGFFSGLPAAMPVRALPVFPGSLTVTPHSGLFSSFRISCLNSGFGAAGKAVSQVDHWQVLPPPRNTQELFSKLLVLISDGFPGAGGMRVRTVAGRWGNTCGRSCAAGPGAGKTGDDISADGN